MQEQDLYLRFFVALAIGLALGVERGWRQRDEPSGSREAGVRTFTLFALTGFAAGASVAPLGPAFAAVVALGVLALVTAGYMGDLMRDATDRGMTTEVAAYLTFVLGGLCAVGALLEAAVSAVVAVTLLHQKDALHRFVQNLERFELAAAVQLLLVSVVLLPVLPDQGYGPGGVLNPYRLWWAVVVIAAMGLAGYAAMKVVGAARGALLMGLLGGLVSSTAVTVNASRASKTAGEEAAWPLAGAIAVAQAVMFARTGVLVFALDPALLPLVAAPLALGALSAASVAVFVAWRERGRTSANFSPGTPDALDAAVRFAIFVAVVLVFAHYAQAVAGGWGLIASGLLSGTVDVDAATVSATRFSGASEDAAAEAAAGASIAAAILSNSLVKSGIAVSLGSRTLARPAVATLVGSALAALAAALLVRLAGV